MGSILSRKVDGWRNIPMLIRNMFLLHLLDIYAKYMIGKYHFFVAIVTAFARLFFLTGFVKEKCRFCCF
ncbi:hypothetical protein KFK09_028187 [Dendrobium nobile]|uniref:Uncharacterized protein n=1 Tax=Dendrobium nobile TaxID=94219 RepID=A0A8T3A1V2_DENNO|nr:hypothetical protein KFK09_028187 [Dendrobium nobile]